MHVEKFPGTASIGSLKKISLPITIPTTPQELVIGEEEERSDGAHDIVLARSNEKILHEVKCSGASLLAQPVCVR